MSGPNLHVSVVTINIAIYYIAIVPLSQSLPCSLLKLDWHSFFQKNILDDIEDFLE